MAVIRVNKTKDYTIINNNCFKNKEMSLKAKGLLSLMLSLPKNWNYTVSGLVSICKESETSIKSTLNELKKFGYLTITKKKPNETSSGRFEYEYNIYEKPQKQEGKKQGVENQPLENQPLENLGVENHPLYKDTKELNTNISTTNNKKNKKKKDFSFILESYSTDEEILSLLNDWLDNRKSKHLAMTESSIKLNLNKLDNLASESNMSVKDYLTEVVCRGWGSFFVINNYGNNQAKNKNDGWCFNPNEEDDLDFIK